MKYIQSELIKNKKSFAVKMLVIVPVVTVILAILMMMGTYVQILAYNWWYIIFLPFVLAYVSARLISNDRKKNFHGLFGMLERKQDLGYGKIIVATFYLAVTNGVFFVLTGMAGAVFGNQIGLMDNLLASVALTVTFAWQIPLILLLTLKMNAVVAVVANVACNMGIACFCAAENTWWIPFAIPARMMCIILGILPNGLLAQDRSLLGNNVTIAGGVVITLIMYAVTALCFGRIFSKQAA